MPATMVVARDILSPMPWCVQSFSVVGERVKGTFEPGFDCVFLAWRNWSELSYVPLLILYNFF